MCCGSAARRRFGAADHALAQVRPRQFIFLLGGGGVVRLTAKPRYLLLLHRGNEKSNTVTALILTKWCQENHLSLNINKTKELVVDFRRQSRDQDQEPLA